MTKEVEKHECKYCDSLYKLMYELSSTSGFPKFCPFCSEPMFEEEYDVFNRKDREDREEYD